LKEVSEEARQRLGSREFQTDGTTTEKAHEENRKRMLVLKTEGQMMSGAV